MRRRWIALGTGLVLVTVGLVSVGIFHGLGVSSNKGGEEVIAVASSPLHQARARPGDGPLVQNIDGLLADGSPAAWGKIVSLYPGSSDETKRKVLRQVAAQTELERVIGYLLATVGEDPTPAESDRMLDEATAILKASWKTPEDFDYGRQSMVMQKTDKRRWVLASGLVAFAKGVDERSPFHPLKGSLEAKLIDVFSQTKDPFVKSSLIAGVRSLGGADAALILAKGPNVRDDELEALTERQAATDQALQGTGTR